MRFGKKLIFFGIIFSGITGCILSSRNCVDMDFARLDKKNLNTISELKKRAVTSESNINVVFVNNPHCISDNHSIALYANNELLYVGSYAEMFKAKMIKKNKGDTLLVHFSIELFEPNDDRPSYSIQDKSIISWEEEYNYLYICFFPDNDEPDMVHFFPQKSAIIQ